MEELVGFHIIVGVNEATGQPVAAEVVPVMHLAYVGEYLDSENSYGYDIGDTEQEDDLLDWLTGLLS